MVERLSYKLTREQYNVVGLVLEDGSAELIGITENDTGIYHFNSSTIGMSCDPIKGDGMIEIYSDTKSGCRRTSSKLEKKSGFKFKIKEPQPTTK